MPAHEAGAGQQPGAAGESAVKTPHAPLRRVVRLFRPYRVDLAVIAAASVVSAVVASVPPFLLRYLVDVAIPQRKGGLVTAACLGMLASYSTTSALGVMQTWLTNRVGQQVMHDLRTSVYRRLQALSLAFFTTTRGGEIQSRIANDIGGIDNAVTSTASVTLSSLTALVATVVTMVLMDWRLTLLALAVVPVYAILNVRIARQRQRLTLARQNTLADLSSQVEQSLSVGGILLGRTLGQQAGMIDRFERDSRTLSLLEQQQRMAGRWLRALVQLTFSVIPVAIFWYAGQASAAGWKAVSIGTVVAFATLQARMLPPVAQLLSLNSSLTVALTLLGRIFEYLDLPVSMSHGGITLPGRPTTTVALSMRGVSFTYPGHREPAVDQVDLIVTRGTHVAIVGATGSGKTTVGYLLARIYDPQCGTVTVDGHDIRTLDPKVLAQHVGFLPQEPFLLHDTVANNLRFAAPGSSDDKLREVLQAVGLGDKIDALPDGMDTIVGSRGYRFSGGEKQRLALARLLLRDTPVLLLDEATSALDRQTERQVCDNLRVAARDRTLLTITHRLSLAEQADVIVVMDSGRVVEVGTPTELRSHDGPFTRLASRGGANPVLER